MESGSTAGIASTYLLLVLDAWQDLGMTAEQRQDFLLQHELEEKQLQQPVSRVPLQVLNSLLNEALLAHNPFALAECIGARMKLSMHGYIGFAAMTAQHVAQALQIAEKYVPLRIDHVWLRLERQGDLCHLFVEDHLNLHPLREALLLALVYGFYRMGEMATGKRMFARVDLDFPEPPGLKAMAEATAGALRFQQPCNRFIFQAHYLQYPLLMADPVSCRLAVEHCEKEFQQRVRPSGWMERICARVDEVLSVEQRILALEEVAAQLHLSTRTLKRRLAEHQTTWTLLVESARKRRAALLLEEPSCRIEQVAEQLGYADVANFTRAFKRWTGQTPSAFRSQLR